MSSGRDEAARLAGPIEVTDRATLDAIYEFRVAVWRETGSIAKDAFSDGAWQDDVDDRSKHWVIRCDEEIVGAARLSIHSTLDQVPEAHVYLDAGLRPDGPVASPYRVVVSPSARRRGLASLLLDTQDEAGRRAGAVLVVRQAAPAMLAGCWRRVAGGAWPRRRSMPAFRVSSSRS